MTALSPAPDLSPEEAERVAVFDAAEEPEEVTVERVARAIGEAEHAHDDFGFPCRCGWDAGFGRGWEERVARHRLMALATAATAALRGDRAPLAGQHTTDEEADRG